ncbi:iron ABC transporter permease [Rhodobacteraceae bacterium 2CG4]|uniref:Iron ABC transporter permease n=1 Tax=Halovulum marinum TaxID=2662447 RepID=A0A6L5YVF8_9RHOB|nr:lipocalin-like domain-containing protein [Halovulum marinum]MSU88333.1 iron ABC transporter permease [Halovulum marinum]
MRARLLPMLAGVLFAAAAHAQGYAGLGTDAEGYGVVSPDYRLTFPRDHQPHPEFRIEWWYVTANLSGPDGAPLGLQWTLFRQAVRPPGDTDADGWASPQVWMGHAAVTTAREHRVAETFARGGVGQAGVTAGPFEAWIDDWAMTAADDSLDRLRLRARGADFSYDLTLRAEGPLVPQGQDGYSVKSAAGQASHYYSQPFYSARGTVTLDGRGIDVSGRAWLDREWSSQPLTGAQTGWDWFALHLPDGAKLMAYRLRSADGSAYVPGTWIAADGTPTPLADGVLEIEPLAWHRAEGGEIPVRWRVRYPDRGLDLTVAALNPDSFMTTAFPYWEGPVSYTGTHRGEGYLEMTGYRDD